MKYLIILLLSSSVFATEPQEIPDRFSTPSPTPQEEHGHWRPMAPITPSNTDLIDHWHQKAQENPDQYKFDGKTPWYWVSN